MFPRLSPTGVREDFNTPLVARQPSPYLSVEVAAYPGHVAPAAGFAAAPPATVCIFPLVSIMRTTSLAESAKYKFPATSSHGPKGLSIFALVAGPPSPV